MLKDKEFYHSHTRNIVILFGQLFNNIVINRTDSSNAVKQVIQVPILYSAKEKFVERIKAAPTLDTGRSRFEIVLPIMGFEITGLSYDPARKLTTTTRQTAIDTNNDINAGYVSTPYDLNVELTIYAKNQDDGFQILEQILPYFNPDFSVALKELPELGITRNIQIKLDNISPSYDYAGDMAQRTTILWTLQFTIKMNYFGYIEKANVIKETIVSLFSSPETLASNTTTGVRIDTTVTPSNADPSGVFDYLQEFDNLPL